MYVAICGGRNYPPERARRWLAANNLKIFGDRPAISCCIIHGACGLDASNGLVTGKMRGADLGADEFAILNGYPVIRMPARWLEFGSAAGPKRNVDMLVRYPVELVIAFPGDQGTRNMMIEAQKRYIPVLETDGWE